MSWRVQALFDAGEFSNPEERLAQRRYTLGCRGAPHYAPRTPHKGIRRHAAPAFSTCPRSGPRRGCEWSVWKIHAMRNWRATPSTRARHEGEEDRPRKVRILGVPGKPVANTGSSQGTAGLAAGIFASQLGADVSMRQAGARTAAGSAGPRMAGSAFGKDSGGNKGSRQEKSHSADKEMSELVEQGVEDRKGAATRQLPECTSRDTRR